MGDAVQNYFYFIKLIGQVLFGNFPLINEPQIINKWGPYESDKPSRPH